MKKTNRYFELKYLVECCDNSHGRFEVIAAFNVDVVAVKYADDCRKNAPSTHTYRVMERTDKSSFHYKAGS